ncbi:tail fiber domain-containing protein [Serratia marcescens]|uniref:tail fiber domain-containing protein n=1 Tax=Serratia marcescens TaxID=615 RepID=UPI00074522C8|nr:tail fiber domain-containing protein [Serratia marcescens]MDP8609907.1 tail fiber domain-containing protein [Serratia marcescens]MDP8615008.1 tail fiber domain-containing protein [Serratia marcescens]MDP8645062.1 tail fiber domain-containing protein [Serratia marcescens]MDP8655000.1 tail fiber domain-containing protein [Serratia marcescens]MDP8659963.1 tail fiber domain-containing protein [Serratia marcescens]
MAEEKKNAQVLNGVNDDIAELKSLSTLRQRVVSDGEIVSKSANGFRLANGNTGVMLRNDGEAFYLLTTQAGQAQNGQWNTSRPFAFSLASGRVALGNGVDISGGAMVSHNAGISTATTGPAPLINGQVYDAAAVHTNFTSGNVTTAMLMGSRVVAGKEDYGLLSYRDWQGNWNELQVRPNAELSVGQLIKRNANGWIWAAGNQNVNNNADRITNGMHIQGAGDLSADLYHYERIGKHHMLALHVANGGADGWYEFRNDGHAYTNGAWNSSSDVRMKTDITTIDGALDKLANIGGYTYLKQGVPEAGVIAQEVESVLPQSVTQTELKLNDGSVLKDARGININGVVALLVEALKEERAARETLESRLAALEGMISSQ